MHVVSDVISYFFAGRVLKLRRAVLDFELRLICLKYLGLVSWNTVLLSLLLILIAFWCLELLALELRTFLDDLFAHWYEAGEQLGRYLKDVLVFVVMYHA